MLKICFLILLVVSFHTTAFSATLDGCACAYTACRYDRDGLSWTTCYKVTGVKVTSTQIITSELMQGQIFDGNRNSYKIAKEACETALKEFTKSGLCPK
ncbi:MAG: hypothetical protein AABY64_13035 [Bdellovibrionota bacterium]